VKDLKLTNSNMEFIIQELRKLDLSQPKRLVLKIFIMEVMPHIQILP